MKSVSAFAASRIHEMIELRPQDSVSICGYCISAVPYTRNLMLIYRKKARDAALVPTPDE